MTITEAIKQAGYATNDFQAAHIANGLRLYELPTEAEQLARVELYRKTRNYGTPAKVAYGLAIDGMEYKIPLVHLPIKIRDMKNGKYVYETPSDCSGYVTAESIKQAWELILQNFGAIP